MSKCDMEAGRAPTSTSTVGFANLTPEEGAAPASPQAPGSHAGRAATGLHRRLFGTDGVRGIANQHPMTCEVALALGRAVAYQARSGNHRHRIVIGKDTRLSGYMLEMAFASGVCSMGVDALLVGPMPTPAVAFLTRNMRADAGVMISASHNPYEDNGIKIFARDGFKLPDDKEAQIEHFLDDEAVGKVRPTRGAVGKAFRIEDAVGRYIGEIKRVMPSDMDLSGMTLVIDCAHGAAYKVAPTVFEELGAKVVKMGVSPDGRNINDQCGALYPHALQAAVRQHQADLGLALDGDADRLVVVDNQAEIVDGDALLAIGAWDLLRSNGLRKHTLVATVMSNLALDRKVEELGGQVVRTQVGDRYVVEEMRRGGFCFGGEQSGHLVYLDHATTGDGTLAGIKLLAMLRRDQVALSDLRKILVPFPQQLVNVTVARKVALEEVESVCRLIERIEAEFAGNGRVMVRYSGTEPKVRVLVEGPDMAVVAARAQELAEAITTALGSGSVR